MELNFDQRLFDSEVIYSRSISKRIVDNALNLKTNRLSTFFDRIYCCSDGDYYACYCWATSRYRVLWTSRYWALSSCVSFSSSNDEGMKPLLYIFSSLNYTEQFDKVFAKFITRFMFFSENRAYVDECLQISNVTLNCIEICLRNKEKNVNILLYCDIVWTVVRSICNFVTLQTINRFLARLTLEYGKGTTICLAYKK